MNQLSSCTRQLARWLGVVAITGACARAGTAARPGSAPAASAATDSARFEALIARQSGGGQRDPDTPADPEAAFDARFELASAARGAARATARLAELRAIDTARLSIDQRIDWLMLSANLERTVQDTVLHELQRTPSQYLTLNNLFFQVTGDRPPTPRDWAAIRTDLRRQPRALAIGRRQLREPPPLWTRLASGTARRYADFIDGDFRERMRSAPDSLRPSLDSAATGASRALRAYAVFIDDTLPKGAEGSWASGQQYYDWVLQRANFLPYDANTMIAEGRRLHEETKRALDSLARVLRPGTDWRTLAREMTTRHPEPGKIIAAYEKDMRLALSLLIRDNLVYVPPNQELLMVPTPPQLRETYAWGGYGGGTERDNTYFGRFFVTDVVPGMSAREIDEKLRAQNYGWIRVIALHEGYPGHHLARSYANRNPRALRRQGGNTYYGEGWALYAEDWMGRHGLYDDSPDARLAQLQMRLWRTARVIIDPSIHTGRMTYEQAVQFFVDEVGLERSAAEAEVNRFTTWPTQAPSYIVGWVELEKLKRELQTRLGSRFSEKQYIERVLEAGPLPLALLRRAILARYGLTTPVP